jgi:hypothetical protein
LPGSPSPQSHSIQLKLVKHEYHRLFHLTGLCFCVNFPDFRVKNCCLARPGGTHCDPSTQESEGGIESLRPACDSHRDPVSTNQAKPN